MKRFEYKKCQIGFALALALVSAGCAKKSNGVANADNAVAIDTVEDITSEATNAQAFANTMAASDAFEIASANLALQKSASNDIKKFARMMVAAHKDSTAKLKVASAGNNPEITLNPSLTSDKAATLASLKTSSGRAFDKAFVDAQISGHQVALETLRDYAAGGDVPKLKALAAKLTPVVEMHLKAAKALKV